MSKNPHFKPVEDLIEDLMHHIEIHNGSQLLKALSDQCDQDRNSLGLATPKNLKGIRYYSDIENILSVASDMLRTAEERYNE